MYTLLHLHYNISSGGLSAPVFPCETFCNVVGFRAKTDLKEMTLVKVGRVVNALLTYSQGENDLLQRAQLNQ